MIDILQSSVLMKLNKSLLSIKSFCDQCSSVFTYALLLLVNKQLSNKSQHSI